MLEEMMPRWVPTENVNGFEICPGLYRDEGATAFQSAVNFTVHSKGAVTCELLLFHRKEPEPYYRSTGLAGYVLYFNYQPDWRFPGVRGSTGYDE